MRYESEDADVWVINFEANCERTGKREPWMRGVYGVDVAPTVDGRGVVEQLSGEMGKEIHALVKIKRG